MGPLEKFVSVREVGEIPIFLIFLRKKIPTIYGEISDFFEFFHKIQNSARTMPDIDLHSIVKLEHYV